MIDNDDNNDDNEHTHFNDTTTFQNFTAHRIIDHPLDIACM